MVSIERNIWFVIHIQLYIDIEILVCLPVSDHPNESEITVNTERKDGYLNVEIVIEQVFPYPVCTFKFDVSIDKINVQCIEWNKTKQLFHG